MRRGLRQAQPAFALGKSEPGHSQWGPVCQRLQCQPTGFDSAFAFIGKTPMPAGSCSMP